MAFSTGLAESVGPAVTGWLPSHDPLPFTILFTCIAVALSEITSNTASASMVVPVAIAVSRAAGISPIEPALGATLGPVKAVIYRQDRTADARLIANGIREDFIRLKGRVSVLDTVVPHAKAYKEAATLRIPVHRHERRRDGVMPSASGHV